MRYPRARYRGVVFWNTTQDIGASSTVDLTVRFHTSKVTEVTEMTTNRNKTKHLSHNLVPIALEYSTSSSFHVTPDLFESNKIATSLR